jgi:hypothetical protein
MGKHELGAVHLDRSVDGELILLFFACEGGDCPLFSELFFLSVAVLVTNEFSGSYASRGSARGGRWPACLFFKGPVRWGDGVAACGGVFFAAFRLHAAINRRKATAACPTAWGG